MTEELAKEIDKEMPLPESKDYNRFLAMKAYTFTLQNNEGLRYSEKIISLLKPIKIQPESVYLYLMALNTVGSYQAESKELEMAIKTFKEAEKTYIEFMAKDFINGPMNDFQLFGVIHEPSTTQENCILFAFHTTMFFLYKCYEASENHEMKLKYVMPSIKAKIHLHPIEEFMDSENFNINQLTLEMCPEIYFLIETLEFSKVDFLLAALLFQLVKYKRSATQEKRDKVSKVQGYLSYLYAAWAQKIVYYSIECLKDKTYSEKNPINNEVFKLDVLMENGVEIYMNQFPCEPIVEIKYLEVAVKKGKAWCERAISLIGNWSYEPMENELLMPEFIALENDLKKYANLN